MTSNMKIGAVVFAVQLIVSTVITTTFLRYHDSHRVPPPKSAWVLLQERCGVPANIDAFAICAARKGT